MNDTVTYNVEKVKHGEYFLGELPNRPCKKKGYEDGKLTFDGGLCSSQIPFIGHLMDNSCLVKVETKVVYSRTSMQKYFQIIFSDFDIFVLKLSQGRNVASKLQKLKPELIKAINQTIVNH